MTKGASSWQQTAHSSQRESACILIVEDERIIAMDLRVRLENLGYQVVDIVSSGAEAIDKVKAGGIDLLLMDVIIDGSLDGIQTALQIREFSDIPVVFLTAFSDEKTFDRARKVEQFAYILKPFQERELDITIQTVLQKYTLEKRLKLSERQYRSLFERTLEPLLIVNDQAEVIEANQSAKKLFKKDCQHGSSFYSYFPTSGRAYLSGKFEQMLAHGSARGQFKLVSQKDRSKVLSLELQMQANINPGQHIIILLNTTSRLLAESKIKELARISSDSPHPVMRIDQQGHVLYYNKAALQFIYKWEQAGQESVPAKLKEVIQTLSKAKTVKKLLYRLGGKAYQVRLIFVPDGGYINFYATDISSQVRSKELMRFQRDALEDIARGRTIITMAKNLSGMLQRYRPGCKVAFFNVNTQTKSLDEVRIDNPDAKLLKELVTIQYESRKDMLTAVSNWASTIIFERTKVIDAVKKIDPNRTAPIKDGLAIQPIMAGKEGLSMILIVKWQRKKEHNDPFLAHIRMAANLMAVAVERDQSVKSLTKQALLFSNINDAVVIIDKKGKIIDWNDSSQRLFGYTRFQALGQQLKDLDFLPEGPSEKQLLAQTEPIFDELVYKHKTGKTGYAELSMVPVIEEKGKSSGFMCLFRDITVRKSYEEEISTSQANLKALIENTDDMICSVNLRGNLITTNSAFDSFVERIAGDNLKDKTNFISLLPANIANDLDHYVRRAIEGKKLTTEFNVPLENGLQMVLETSFNPMNDGNGRIQGVSIFARNITQRKQAEDELKRTNFELDSFVYRASHDLRAPLRSILGLLNLLEIDNDEANRMNYVSLARTSINKLDTFIADLTHYSRNSRTEIVPEPINFVQIIEDCVENLKYMERADRIKVYTDIYGNSAFYSDPNRLSIVLLNLISNAIKYQDLEKTDPHLKIRVSSGARNAQILIEDNGRGIKPEYISRIFDMFYRASEESYGSGLGLYITKQVIEKLGGTIAVNSTFGWGTTFAITIPNLNKVEGHGPDERITNTQQFDNFILS